MSVPADRMAPVRPAGDPNKIMGLKKPVFYGIIVVGLILAWYIYKKSQASSAASLQTANAGTEPDTTNGVTAADIGGTPADNSFATQTDETALEEQIQALQNSLFQLQQSNGGNGAGLPVTTTGGSSTTPVSHPINPGTQPGGGQPITGVSTPIEPIHFPFPTPSPGVNPAQVITGLWAPGTEAKSGFYVAPGLPTPNQTAQARMS